MFFSDFGFDTIWVMAYNPETRRYPAVEMVRYKSKVEALAGAVVSGALFEKVNMLWKGFVGGDSL